ncbi:MAG TPA: DUF4926 domain-containing protein [Candidatus Kapabacteria bacterium]|nr:DUF4926 domain-containing protein [Candidatus Kapabacteria bacterium]
MTTHQKYSRVRLITSKYQSEGVGLGMFGYIIESYGDGKFEVEFSDANGNTIAQIVAEGKDLAAAPENKPN